jgi:hypothetical protein
MALVVWPVFPFISLIILIGIIIWLLTNSVALAIVGAGAALLVKAIAWIVGTIVAGLPLLAFDRTLTAVNRRIRRRRTAQRRQHNTQ